MNHRFKKVAIAGLAVLVMALSTGCDEKPETPNYNPTVHGETVDMPSDCQQVVGAGFSSSKYHNYNWVSCYNGKRNLVIYRMDTESDTWYGTTVVSNVVIANNSLEAENQTVPLEEKVSYITASEGKVELQNIAQEQGDSNMSFCEYSVAPIN